MLAKNKFSVNTKVKETNILF